MAKVARYGGYVLAAMTAFAAVHTLNTPLRESALAAAPCAQSASGQHALQLTLIDANGDTVAEPRISLTRDGVPITIEGCRQGTWLMFDVGPGRYRIEAEGARSSRTRTVDVPAKGRTRLAMTFPT